MIEKKENRKKYIIKGVYEIIGKDKIKITPTSISKAIQSDMEFQ